MKLSTLVTFASAGIVFVSAAAGNLLIAALWAILTVGTALYPDDEGEQSRFFGIFALVFAAGSLVQLLVLIGQNQSTRVALNGLLLLYWGLRAYLNLVPRREEP